MRPEPVDDPAGHRLALYRDLKGSAPLALTPAGSAEDVAAVASTLRGCKVALVVGAEGPGLSRAVLERCRPVRAPLSAGAGSLNVATALAVALHRFAALG